MPSLGETQRKTLSAGSDRSSREQRASRFGVQKTDDRHLRVEDLERAKKNLTCGDAQDFPSTADPGISCAAGRSEVLAGVNGRSNELWA